MMARPCGYLVPGTLRQELVAQTGKGMVVQTGKEMVVQTGKGMVAGDMVGDWERRLGDADFHTDCS